MVQKFPKYSQTFFSGIISFSVARIDHAAGELRVLHCSLYDVYLHTMQKLLTLNSVNGILLSEASFKAGTFIDQIELLKS